MMSLSVSTNMVPGSLLGGHDDGRIRFISFLGMVTTSNGLMLV